MKTTLTITFLLFFQLVNAQCHVSGWIFTGTVEKRIDLPFAQIYFNDPSDTTKILYSTLTDLQGLFYLGSIPPGRYIGYAEKANYKSGRAKLTVPEGQLVWKTNYLLNKISEQRQGTPSINYPIAQLTQSRKINDILNSIPGMSYDEKKLVLSVKEGEVMIMMDGGFQLPDKVKDIPTRRIKSIECYTIESGGRNRYVKAIDIITK